MTGRQHLIALGIAGPIVLVDFLTKRMAESLFADGDVVLIPGFFGFTYTENPGAAFSLFRNAGPLLGLAAIVVTALLIWVLRAPRPRVEVVAFGFVIGGAVGNLVDRLTRGEGLLDGRVIDWVDLWWIPTFNIADAAVTTAVGLLLIQAWRTRERSQSRIT